MKLIISIFILLFFWFNIYAESFSDFYPNDKFSLLNQYQYNQHIFLLSNSRFDIIPISFDGNYNFNRVRFEQIELNSLMDNSLDFIDLRFATFDEYDKTDNFNYSERIRNKKNIEFALSGGNQFGNAFVNYSNQYKSFRWNISNNYTVSNINNINLDNVNLSNNIDRQIFTSFGSIGVFDENSTLDLNFLIDNNKKNMPDNFDDYRYSNDLRSAIILSYRNQAAKNIIYSGKVFFNSLKNTYNISNIPNNDLNEYTYGAFFKLEFPTTTTPYIIETQYKRHNASFYDIIDKKIDVEVEDLGINLKKLFQLTTKSIFYLDILSKIYNPLYKNNQPEVDKFFLFGINLKYKYIISEHNHLQLTLKQNDENADYNHLFAKIIDTNNLNYISKISSRSIKLDYTYSIDSIFYANIDFTNSAYSTINLNKEYTSSKNIFLNDNLTNMINLKLLLLNNIIDIGLNAVYRIEDKFKIDYNEWTFLLPRFSIKLLLNKTFTFGTKIAISVQYQDQIQAWDKAIEIPIKNELQFNFLLSQQITKQIDLFVKLNNILDSKIALLPNYQQLGFSIFGGFRINF